MNELDKYFNMLLEKLNEPTYYTQNKETIKNNISTPQFHSLIENHLKDGKKYSVLKFIDRMDLHFDNDLYLHYFIYEENKNANMYILFFNLFIKDLITKTCIDKIKSKYNLDYQKELEDIEKKCLYKKMETDRHFMKKERNRMTHEGATPFVTRSEMLSIKGVTPANKRVYVIDATEIFYLNVNRQKEQSIYSKIHYVHRRFFRHSEYEYGFLACLDKNINKKMKVEFENYIMRSRERRNINPVVVENRESVQKDIAVEIKEFRENFKYTSQKFYDREDLHAIYEKYNYSHLKLKRIVDIFRQSQHVVYIVSRVELIHLLSEASVFGLNSMQPENFISARQNDMHFILDLIKEKENTDKIVFCGKKLSYDIDNTLIINGNELFEAAINWKNYSGSSL